MILAGALQWVARDSVVGHKVGSEDRGRTERASLSRAGGGIARLAVVESAYRAKRQRPTLPVLTQKIPQCSFPTGGNNELRIDAHMDLAWPMTTECPPCDQTVRPAESAFGGRCPTQPSAGLYPMAKPPFADECEGWQPADIHRTSAQSQCVWRRLRLRPEWAVE